MNYNDQLDRVIKDALSTYIEEPRPGLEVRVVAHVRTAKRSVHWLRWSIALATAACVVAAIALSLRTSPKPEVAHRSPLLRVPEAHKVQPPVQEAHFAPPRKHIVRAVPRPEPLPKLAQFPEPSPLTNDEKELVVLARRANPEAVKAITHSEQRETAPIEIPKLQIGELQIPPLSDGGN